MVDRAGLVLAWVGMLGRGGWKRKRASRLTRPASVMTFRREMSSQFLSATWSPALLFWAAAIVCAVAHLGILRSVLRSRERGVAEIAWAVLPAVVLAAVLVMTWRSMHVGV